MKTTVDIPDDVLRDTMKYSQAVTKRDAVVKAMEEYNRRHRMAKLARHLGTFDEFMTLEELMRLRKEG